MNHPLEFFIDYIDNNRINEDRDTFFHPEKGIGDFIVVRHQEMVVWEKMTNDPDEDAAIFTLDDHIAKMMDNEAQKAIVSTDLFLIDNLDDETCLQRINSLLHTLNELGLKAEEKGLSKYPSIIRAIQKITDWLTSKRNYILDKHKTVQPPVVRIKWLGNDNQFGTLFYELLNGQDNGLPFIEVDKDVLMQFIYDSFLDSAGKPFVKGGVVAKILSGGSEKRAGHGSRFVFPPLKDGKKVVSKRV